MRKMAKLIGADKVLNKLSKLQKNISQGINQAVEEVAVKGQERAKQSLLSTDHTQKFGDTLVNEIGLSLEGNKGKIYTPINDTDEMRAQMAYAEFGAGVTTVPSNEYFNAPPQNFSGKNKLGSAWGYYTTEHDKNPNVKTVVRKGEEKTLGVTDRSTPARFMYQASTLIRQELPKLLKMKIKVE